MSVGFAWGVEYFEWDNLKKKQGVLCFIWTTSSKIDSLFRSAKNTKTGTRFRKIE